MTGVLLPSIEARGCKCVEVEGWYELSQTHQEFYSQEVSQVPHASALQDISLASRESSSYVAVASHVLLVLIS